MGRATSEEKSRLYEQGQADAKAGRDLPWNGPWHGAFESDEHYKDRNDAWEAGVDNYNHQKSGK